MNYRQPGVELDRKPSVRSRNEQSLATNAPQFRQQLHLVLPGADVLDDRAGMSEVEAGVPERQRAPVGAPKPDSGVELFQEGCVVGPDCGQLVLVWIPGFHVV